MAIYQGNQPVANNYKINNITYCVPIGSIISYSSTTLPKGFLLCNGAEISKTDYADLYKIIGDNFGTATDTTKFKLPDLRDKFIQGANNNLGENKSAGLPDIEGELGFFNPISQGNYWQGLNYGRGAFKNSVVAGVTSGVSCAITQVMSLSEGDASIAKFNASKSNSIYGNSETVQPPAVCLYYIIKATKLSDIPVDASGIIDDTSVADDTTWSSKKISTLQKQYVTIPIKSISTTLTAKSSNPIYWENEQALKSLIPDNATITRWRYIITGVSKSKGTIKIDSATIALKNDEVDSKAAYPKVSDWKITPANALINIIPSVDFYAKEFSIQIEYVPSQI